MQTIRTSDKFKSGLDTYRPHLVNNPHIAKEQ